MITSAGLAIITRDIHIESRLREKRIVLQSGARVFAITTHEGQLDKWGLLEVVVTQWRQIEAIAETPGPYIYALTRTSLSRIKL